MAAASNYIIIIEHNIQCTFDLMKNWPQIVTNIWQTISRLTQVFAKKL